MRSAALDAKGKATFVENLPAWENVGDELIAFVSYPWQAQWLGNGSPTVKIPVTPSAARTAAP